MKIYFSGSIRGGRGHHEWYAFIGKELSKYGEVISEFVDSKLLINYGYGQSSYTDKQLYLRDMKIISEVDIIVADITVPSLGVGYEIAYAEKLNKKIFCIYHQTEGKEISAMITGNQNCKIFPYKNKEEIPEIIKSIFK